MNEIPATQGNAPATSTDAHGDASERAATHWRVIGRMRSGGDRDGRRRQADRRQIGGRTILEARDRGGSSRNATGLILKRQRRYKRGLPILAARQIPIPWRIFGSLAGLIASLQILWPAGHLPSIWWYPFRF